MLTDFKGFEWPDRLEAKREWERSTREEGQGVFIIAASETPGVPEWCTEQTLKENVPSILYWRITQELTRAHQLGGYAILVISKPMVFCNIVKIPFDQTQDCHLIAEMIPLPKGAKMAEQSEFPCPKCWQEMDFYTNVGRDHYGVCLDCEAYFWLGENLFSSWRYETEADWKRNQTSLSQFIFVGHPPIRPNWDQIISKLDLDDLFSSLED